MSKLSFVVDGALVVAPANYGLVDSSIGGQLARKMLPNADGRTRRGLVAINSMRDRIVSGVKSYVSDPALFGIMTGQSKIKFG